MKLLLSFILFSGSAFASAWNASNNPYVLDRKFKSSLASLPLEGKLSDHRLGWPGNHWASNIGGISHRWSAGTPQNFSYKFLGRAELKKLERSQINELSPAEKFDIFRGDYSYPTVRSIWAQNSPDENPWHGICHGYAPAAVNYPEPARVILTNPDGIEVEFYSSDVAGLLSHYYARVAKSAVTLIGNRCNYADGSAIPRRSEAACSDLNAGAFFIVLANQIGIKGQTFIADIDPFAEVWNHVPVSYTIRLLEELPPVATSAPGTFKRIKVESTVVYAAAIAPKFDPVIGTSMAEYANEYYEFIIELDKAENVIGGEWISKRHPDFAWTQKKAIFKGYWSALDEVYTPAE